MQTDKIMITSSGAGFVEALEEATKFAEYTGLDRKSALKVRLLTEETLGLIGAITGEFNALFSIESDKDCSVRIHLTAKTEMDFEKRKELIDASTDKKNASAKGFMGKIRQLIENAMYSVDEVGSLSVEYGDSSLMYGNMGMMETTPSNFIWSLNSYRTSVETASQNDDAAKEAWDELEKSIVASIADDVKVGIKGSTVELVIEKRSFK